MVTRSRITLFLHTDCEDANITAETETSNSSGELYPSVKINEFTWFGTFDQARKLAHAILAAFPEEKSDV